MLLNDSFRTRILNMNTIMYRDKCSHLSYDQGGTSFVDISCYFCRVLVMLLCASVYCCMVVPCLEMADLLALVCDV